MFWNKKEKIDLLGIGDIVTDSFIELDQAWIETDNSQKEKELCMKFGSKIPYKGSVIVPAVGNSANACVAAHRLGLKSSLISNTGDDKFGKEQFVVLKENGVENDFVKIHKDRKSNCHYVLNFGAERTILINHQEWDYKMPKISEPPRAIYLSSLAPNSLNFHLDISKYLKSNPDVRLIFQPGTFQMKLGYEKLKDLYQNSWLFFCNKEEAKQILETTEEDITKLLEMMNGKGVQIPIITDGPNGAYAFQDNSIWQVPMYPDPKPPVDRTGAGDSFASTITSALLLGKPLEEALLWGPINSMSVVQYIGAQEGLLTKKQIEEYLKIAPPSYKTIHVK
jgi:ribokinase